MAYKAKTVSITPEQDQFIEENDLSPSGLLQQKIMELIESSKISASRLKEEVRKMESWKDIAIEAREFIERKGLLDEYMKEQGY